MKYTALILLCFFGFISFSQNTSDYKYLDLKSLSPQEQVDTLVKIVRSKYYKKEYAEAIEKGNFGKKIAKNIDDFKSYYKFNSLIGNSLVKSNDTLQALRIFEDVLEEAKVKNDSSIILGGTIDVANVYILKNQKTEAIQQLKGAIPMAKKLKDTIRLYILNYNIADIYIENRELKNARTYIDNTQVYVASLRAKPYHAGFDMLLGSLYYLENKPNKAITTLEKSIVLSEELNFTDALIPAYEYLGKAYAQIGKTGLAYQAQIKVDENKTKNYKRDKIEALENIKSKLKLTQYQNDLEASQLQNELAVEKMKTNKRWLYALIAGIFGLLILLASFFLSFKRRKRLLSKLRIKNREYLDAVKESDKLAKTKSEFFSNVSHELRTPLYGIIGLSSILLDSDKLDVHKDDVKSLKFSADYLLALINDVLQISKLDVTKKSHLNKKEFDLRRLIIEINNSLEFIKVQNGNTNTLYIDDNIPQLIIGDEIKLSQVLINLLSNAYKFTENGIVSLTIKIDKKLDNFVTLNFCIEDTGIGISKDKQEVIFNEFIQANQKDESTGTGLGLSIVQKIITLHDSKIILESILDKGTKISFTIKYEVSKNIHHEKIVTPRIEDKSLIGKTILIVDDNKINQIVTRKILEKEGCHTLVVSSGSEGIETVRNHASIDLILMDINMPILNGYEASLEIRKFNKNIPIIALTAVERDEIKDNLKIHGINDFIIKPYDQLHFNDKILNNLLD